MIREKEVMEQKGRLRVPKKSSLIGDHETLRLLSRILTMYYVDGQNQVDIGRALGLSTSKVNRLLQHARAEGMVEIKVRLPYQQLFDLEDRLEQAFGLQEATVLPAVPGDEQGRISTLGRAAADLLVQRLRDGDVIAVGAGTGVHAVVEALEARRSFNVRVVPATGGLQGRAIVDANYLASVLAEKLGGTAYQLHAPAFVDTSEQREFLLAMAAVKDVLGLARQATVALVGIGSVRYTSWVTHLNPAWADEVGRMLNERRGVGDICLRVFDLEGRPCAPEYEARVIGLSLDEIKAIPLSIGVAAGPEKWDAVHGALRGGYIKVLVTDEPAAAAVLEHFDERFKAHFGTALPVALDNAIGEPLGRRLAKRERPSAAASRAPAAGRRARQGT